MFEIEELQLHCGYCDTSDTEDTSKKKNLAFTLCASSSPLGFEKFHSNAQQNEIVHLKNEKSSQPPPLLPAAPQ